VLQAAENGPRPHLAMGLDAAGQGRRAAKLHPHSSSPSVGVVQTAQDGPGDKSPSRLNDGGERTLQTEAAMRSVAIVVVDQLGQHHPQGELVDHMRLSEGKSWPNRGEGRTAILRQCLSSFR